MRNIVLAVLAVTAATAAAAQGMVSRSYNVGSFNGIEVGGPYDVEVRTGLRTSISGTGTERLMQRTIVELKNGNLSIHPQRDDRWFSDDSYRWGRNEKARFVVTVPQLKGAAIGGSGNISVDRVRGDQFTGRIGGSGNLRLGSVEVQSLDIGIGGSGSVRALGGRARHATYNIGGSGDIDAAAVSLQSARISIAGSGDVAARASSSADVRIVGSGGVTVLGGARCNVSKMGSGRVRCS